jgi:uncharacterized radical SAM superfamily Fe-S cluster-containing enzyme
MSATLPPAAPARGGSPAAAEDFGLGRHIKHTSSICPICLQRIGAEVFERDGAVWMDKTCDQHGAYSALLASDVRHYYEGAPVTGPALPCCSGGGCGPAPSGTAADASLASVPWTNHSCTVLIEITERCNLTCPTCFAGSSPQHSSMMSMETFRARLERLTTGGKQNADVIQFSGGEPTIHPELCEMLDLAFANGFHDLCINSNGIKLAQADFVDRLAGVVARHPQAALSVYLQFDGFDDDTHLSLRGRGDLLAIKQRALSNCLAAGLTVHPVMTLTRGVNDHEIGRFVGLARDNPRLKHLMVQPAMYSGRYDNPRRVDRLTLADTVALICEQSGLFEPADFGPIPCSDPNCYGIAVALRTGAGDLLPISRYFPQHAAWEDDESRDLIAALSDTLDGPAAFSAAVRWATAGDRMGRILADLDESAVDRLLEAVIEVQQDRDAAWERMLIVSIKPFMDAFTYDQDRIDKCCVHILDDDGNPVSFCEFNAVTRPRMMAQRSADG